MKEKPSNMLVTDNRQELTSEFAKSLGRDLARNSEFQPTGRIHCKPVIERYHRMLRAASCDVKQLKTPIIHQDQ